MKNYLPFLYRRIRSMGHKNQGMVVSKIPAWKAISRQSSEDNSVALPDIICHVDGHFFGSSF